MMTVDKLLARLKNFFVVPFPKDYEQAIVFLLQKFSKENAYTTKLVETGKKMRKAQIDYFKYRSAATLQNAKDLERDFDKLLSTEPTLPEQGKQQKIL